MVARSKYASNSVLASWNQTSKYCTEDSWEVQDGAVSTDSSGDAALSTTGMRPETQLGSGPCG
jgi:hypothetical protein